MSANLAITAQDHDGVEFSCRIGVSFKVFLAGVALLLLGLSPQTQAAVVSLPDIIGNPGPTVVLPLGIDDATGVQAADLRIEYDPAVLQAITVSKTAFTVGMTLFFNFNPGPQCPMGTLGGVICISLFAIQSLNGGGALVEITFDVIARGRSPLDIVMCMLNEEEIPCTQEDGFLTAGPPDHYLCYMARITPGTTRFTPRDVTLADQFETGSFKARKPESLCNPADKNTEGITDPVTHLKGYQIIPKTPHEPRTNIKVENQFHPALGELFVDTIKPDRLLVPTAKSLTGLVGLPGPNNVDHYKCYKVKVTSGTSRFKRIKDVLVKDQFNAEAKLFDLKKPTRLCTPVDKNGEGIKNSDNHLMCYQAKPASGQPKHVPVTGIFVNNQFGPEQLDTIKEEELCVPSKKILSP